jgi:cell cycle related kinase
MHVRSIINALLTTLLLILSSAFFFREIKALQQIEENENVSYNWNGLWCILNGLNIENKTFPQIVKLRDVFPHGTGFVLVFDYMLSDLSEIIRDSERPLTEGQVKSYMLMLLKGVMFMHENSIMHRVSVFLFTI